jgi:hypothetical protein
LPLRRCPGWVSLSHAAFQLASDYQARPSVRRLHHRAPEPAMKRLHTENCHSARFELPWEVAENPLNSANPEGRWSVGEFRAPTLSEFVRGAVDVFDGPLTRELEESALDLPPDTADGDAENTLATLQEINDLIC